MTTALSRLRALLDLVYPPRCAGCGARGAWLCPVCVARVKPLQAQPCVHCRRPLAATRVAEGAGRCAQCSAVADGGLAGMRVVARYEEPLRAAIHAFKYRGQRGLAQPLGALLVPRVTALAAQADVLVPVPLHASRERQRGYNQAALLAAACAAQAKLPVELDALQRTRATRPQVGLPAAARRENVANAFVATPRGARALAGKHVLLVDDVTTSGATLEAAATALRRAGVASVWGLALAQPSLPADGTRANEA